MIQTLPPRRDSGVTPLPPLSPLSPLPPRSSRGAPSPRVEPSDLLFTELLDACRHSGGLARCSEVAGRMARRRPDGVAWLEDCLRRRTLVSLDWYSVPWLPLFQFDLSDMTPREAVCRASAELIGVMNGWDLAAWFVRPQCLLQHRSPLDLLDTQPELVRDAARQEHFIRGA